MVAYLVDVSRWQVERPDPLDLADAVTAGYTVANVALTGGRGYVSGSWARDYVNRARELRMDLSCYHWLDGRTSGGDQAVAQIARMRDLFGSLDGFAHIVDVEETGANGITRPTWEHVRDYVDAVQTMLGRFIAIYTGDWYWPRTWPGGSITPFLMAAPNAGYLTAYPGDTSSHWFAGYGTWNDLAIMQYRVGPLAGIDVSQSAIRDPAVWAELTGEVTGMTFAPNSLLAARKVFQDNGTGLSAVELGIVGDTDHEEGGDSYHLGKDQLRARNGDDRYSVDESSRDRNPTNAASALDVGWFSIARNGKTHNLRTFSRWLVAQCEAGTSDTQWIREVIYSPDGDVVKRWDRLKRRSTGDRTHLGHSHISGFRDSENQDRAAVFRRYFAEIEGDDMPLDNTDKTWLKSEEYTKAVAAGVVKALAAWKFAPDHPSFPSRTFQQHVTDAQDLRDAFVHTLDDPKVANRPQPGSGFDTLIQAGIALAGKVDMLAQAVAAGESAQADRDQALMSAILQAIQEVKDAGADPVTIDELTEAIKAVFREGTGTAT
jgi:hypothetical protein